MTRWNVVLSLIPFLFSLNAMAKIGICGALFKYEYGGTEQRMSPEGKPVDSIITFIERIKHKPDILHNYSLNEKRPMSEVVWGEYLSQFPKYKVLEKEIHEISPKEYLILLINPSAAHAIVDYKAVSYNVDDKIPYIQLEKTVPKGEDYRLEVIRGQPGRDMHIFRIRNYSWLDAHSVNLHYFDVGAAIVKVSNLSDFLNRD